MTDQAPVEGHRVKFMYIDMKGQVRTIWVEDQAMCGTPMGFRVRPHQQGPSTSEYKRIAEDG